MYPGDIIKPADKLKNTCGAPEGGGKGQNRKFTKHYYFLTLLSMFKKGVCDKNKLN